MFYRILVIEDDEGIRAEVLEWLEFEGYIGFGAVNGREGIEIAQRELPDLIISDINMPEMNGYRMLVELRANRATSTIPVIFLTARTTRRDIRYGMEMGAEDYITKPFTNEELLTSVKTQLSKLESVRTNTNKQLHELRSTITHTLPHELRTPLICILGYGELLDMDAENLTPRSIREMASNIVASGQRLNHLIENYLLYAQLELFSLDPHQSGAYQRAILNKPATILTRTCETVAQRYNRTADTRLDLAANFPTRVTDIDLDKIVTEILDNALKFSDPQSIVQVSTRGEAHWLQIKITDRGRGMTSEEINRIGAYTQFKRDIYEQQGAGLGLTIAKLLTELYGGYLEIESVPDRETSVIIHLLVANPKIQKQEEPA